MHEVPYEYVLLGLLQKLPGYTVALLEAEPAQRVERWLIFLNEEAKWIRSQQAASR